MYYPPKEIKILTVKILNKLFYFRHKRMPTINEIWHMQNYGEVKKLKFKTLEYITKQKTIIAKTPKKKCIVCFLILENQKARYCQKCAKQKTIFSANKSIKNINQKKQEILQIARQKLIINKETELIKYKRLEDVRIESSKLANIERLRAYHVENKISAPEEVKHLL